MWWSSFPTAPGNLGGWVQPCLGLWGLWVSKVVDARCPRPGHSSSLD